jgi:hypothetical protein
MRTAILYLIWLVTGMLLGLVAAQSDFAITGCGIPGRPGDHAPLVVAGFDGSAVRRRPERNDYELFTATHRHPQGAWHRLVEERRHLRQIIGIRPLGGGIFILFHRDDTMRLVARQEMDEMMTWTEDPDHLGAKCLVWELRRRRK